ncbi:hypothetical protein NLC35_00910 [Candidatus Aminicenantes bacterium AC-334-K16]|jgi:phosphoglycerate-specific signal transduction histidine kinase|nr:hypothetical protein [Candidatus Aminicenantes bacterium AC-334-K16]
MNVKIKTTLIILATLILGVILGAGLHRLYIQHRIKKIFTLQRPPIMARTLERVIQPTPEQRIRIRRILHRHTQRLLEIRREYETKLRQEMTAIQREIDPILTPQQRKRLERRTPPLYRRWLCPPPHHRRPTLPGKTKEKETFFY